MGFPGVNKRDEIQAFLPWNFGFDFRPRKQSARPYWCVYFTKIFYSSFIINIENLVPRILSYRI